MILNPVHKEREVTAFGRSVRTIYPRVTPTMVAALAHDAGRGDFVAPIVTHAERASRHFPTVDADTAARMERYEIQNEPEANAERAERLKA